MCSVRCTACGQLLYGEGVIKQSVTKKLPETVHDLICYACGVVGEIDMLGNNLVDIAENITLKK